MSEIDLENAVRTADVKQIKEHSDYGEVVDAVVDLIKDRDEITPNFVKILKFLLEEGFKGVKASHINAVSKYLSRENLREGDKNILLNVLFYLMKMVDTLDEEEVLNVIIYDSLLMDTFGNFQLPKEQSAVKEILKCLFKN